MHLSVGCTLYCRLSSLSMSAVFAVYVGCLRCLCRLCSLSMSDVFAVYVGCLRCLCRLSSLSMSAVFAVYVGCLRCLCLWEIFVYVGCLRCLCRLSSSYHLYPSKVSDSTKILLQSADHDHTAITGFSECS